MVTLAEVNEWMESDEGFRLEDQSEVTHTVIDGAEIAVDQIEELVLLPGSKKNGTTERPAAIIVFPHQNVPFIRMLVEQESADIDMPWLAHEATVLGQIKVLGELNVAGAAAVAAALR